MVPDGKIGKKEGNSGILEAADECVEEKEVFFMDELALNT